MSRELPPEPADELPAAVPLRLPELYDSPDQTIQHVASHAVPEERRESLHRTNHSRPRSGPVTEVTIDPEVLHRARELAQGDLGRLVLRTDGTVYVANSADRARLIRKNRTFGT
jgi:hypothetical protein